MTLKEWRIRMNKIAVIYWSQTGNTQVMAESIGKGAKDAGADIGIFQVSKFESNEIANYDVIALGCPSMGAEELDDTEFQPFYDMIKPDLKDKKVALFGSYGWGDGEWMRTWQDDISAAGAILFQNEGLILNEMPDEDGIGQCEILGKNLATY